MKEEGRPKLSIGIPVFNGERFIRKCLDSLIHQTFEDFEIIISDNASADGTEKICKEYKELDNRISFFRQESNLEMSQNFNFVLEHAIGKYFMWAAVDDIWHPEFIERNLLFLEKNPNYMGSTSEIEFFYELWSDKDFEKFKDTKPKKKYEFVHPLVGNYEEKIKFLYDFGKFEYLYAIFRTEFLKKSMIVKNFLTWELPTFLKILKFGDFNVEDKVLMYKYMGNKTNKNFYKKIYSTTKNYWKYGTLYSLFPFVPVTFNIFLVVGPRIFFKHLFKRYMKDNYRAQRLVLLEFFSREK